MKKYGIMLIAGLLILSLGLPAYAADNFTLGGSYYLLGQSTIDGDYNGDTDDTERWFKQRMRLSGQIKVNDNVTANIRFDLGEGRWGLDYGTSGWMQANEGKPSINVDRAYVDFDMDMFMVRVGPQLSGAGNYILWDAQMTGILLRVKTPATITVQYSKINENGSTYDEEEYWDDADDDGVVDPGEVTDTRDQDFYGLNVGYSSDTLTFNGFFAMLNDMTNTENSPYGVGLHADTKFGPVGLNAEVNVFGGSVSSTLDAMGTQAYVNGTIGIGDAGKVGVHLFYAMGTDDTANEQQITAILNGAESFDPLGTQGEANGYTYPVGANPFDVSGQSAGVFGFAPHINYSVSDTVTLYGVVGYLTPQEDDNTTLDSVTTASVNVDWNCLANTYLSLGYTYDVRSYENDRDDSGVERKDPRQQALALLNVSF